MKTPVMSEELYRILSKPRWAKNRICSVKAEINSLNECLYPTAIAYDKERVQSSKTDVLSTIEGQIEELQHEYDDLSKTIVQSDNDIRLLCKDLDELERTIIIMRFIGCMTFDKIGAAINYDKSWTYRIYEKAIKKLESALA